MGARIENTFSWSFSRSRTFADCPRKYWFHYYGSWGGWERDASPEARELYRLKKLTGLHLLAGDVVHRALERALVTWKRGAKPDPEALVTWCKSEMQRQYRESHDDRGREAPARFARLFEHEYGPPPDRELLVRIAGKVGTSVRNFFVSAAFGMIRESDPEQWLPIETLDTFDFEGTKVFAVPDFALRQAGEVYIFDWKTGRKNPGNNDQVVLYALFAAAKWDADPDHVRAAPVYLLNGGDYDPQGVSQADRDRVEGIIRESIAAMRGRLDDPGQNAGRKDDFEPTPGHNCRWCNFRGVCPHAQ